MISTRMKLVAAAVMAIGGFLPLGLYWLAFGRAPSITADKAKELLDSGATAALVDVRSAEDFARNHVEAAQNWPFKQISALGSSDNIPERFQGRRLLLICDSGLLSGMAAGKLRQLGRRDVLNVDGGMQAWVASGDKPCGLALCRLKSASGDARSLPFRESTLLEQLAVVWTGFFVKPLYTLLSFAWMIVLWKSRAADLIAFRWAMLCFFVGENFCAANYLAYSDTSQLFEYLHSYGMVLCFGMTTFAVLEGIDLRLAKLSDPKAHCAALSLCHRCIKYADVPCGLRRVFLFLIPATAVLCLLPLCAEPLPVSYNTKIFGTFYNWSHPAICQIYEIRFLPAAAVLLFTVSWVVLQLRIDEPILWSKIFFSAAFGALGFSLFRLVLLQVYRDNLTWFAAWEELTELLFILAAGLVLWTFRRGLFPTLESQHRTPSGAS
jgi:rhodanese-related sulfurtransferase